MSSERTIVLETRYDVAADGSIIGADAALIRPNEARRLGAKPTTRRPYAVFPFGRPFRPDPGLVSTPMRIRMEACIKVARLESPRLAAIMARTANVTFPDVNLRIGTVTGFDAAGRIVPSSLVEVSVTHQHDYAAFVWVVFHEGAEPYEAFGSRYSDVASLAPIGRMKAAAFVRSAIDLSGAEARRPIAAMLEAAR